jgi:hypothetical protein
MSKKRKKKERKVISPPICPYCGDTSIYTDSSRIYGRSYGGVWLCINYPQCDSYVGCHGTSKSPLGRMADKELREWKKRAHAVFDPLWREGQFSRTEAYQLLSKFLEISIEQAHIGMLDVDQCKRIVGGIQKFALEGESNAQRVEVSVSKTQG